MDKDKFLKFTLNYVDDLATHFFELSREKQLVCEELVFPAGFWVDENKKVYTPEISELYRLVTSKKRHQSVFKVSYGATEENLLKLFSWLLENHHNKNVKVILPEKLYEEKIIY